MALVVLFFISLHNVFERWDEHMKKFIPWRTIVLVTFVIVVLIIAAIWGVSHGGGQQPSNYGPNQSPETQQQSQTQSTGWQPVNIGGWQLTLQSAHIDNGYPIYYVPQGSVAKLILHVTFSPQSVALPARINSDDFYVLDLATKQTGYCVSPNPYQNGADWSFEERTTE